MCFSVFFWSAQDKMKGLSLCQDILEEASISCVIPQVVNNSILSG